MDDAVPWGKAEVLRQLSLSDDASQAPGIFHHMENPMVCFDGENAAMNWDLSMENDGNDGNICDLMVLNHAKMMI